jgi:hypothetical protein
LTEGGADPGWNVLAEELVSFPPATVRRLLEVASPESGRSAARSGAPEAARVSATDRRNAEAWLDRELVHLRAVADRAYPVAPSLGRTPSERRLQTAQNEQRRTNVGVRAARPARRGDRAAGDLRRAEPTPRVAAGGQVHPALQVHPARSARAAAPLHRGAAFPELRGLRRLLPGVATLAVLAGLWAGVGALSAVHRPQPGAIPGSTRTAAGLVYVVRPGDTLWSIAARLVPNGDPRPVVADLQQQLHGAPPQPGEHLVLP